MKALFSALLTSLLFASSAVAGDAAAGKVLSARCSACHGATGISVSPLWPNLAGQKEQYLVKQIKAFRDPGNEIVVGFEHENYAHMAVVPESVRTSLAEDFD